ncbi:MAG: hypothetical protein Q4D27_07085 [Coriobacteriia bacterium]|nr:hypothetical protein [Coriobacteriia bacterium]
MNDMAKTKTTMAAAVAAMATAFMLMVCANTALAEDGINIDTVKSGFTYTAIYYPHKDDAGMNVWNLYSGKGKAISSVKSSKTAVGAVKLAKGKKSFNLTIKKAGKTKVTYKYKGKKYAVTFKAVKYTKPVSSLKVGKKQYAPAFAKRPVSNLGLAGGKLVVKAASGWSFQSAEYGNDATGVTKSIKNGKKVPASADYINIAMKHKKSGAIVYITVA